MPTHIPCTHMQPLTHTCTCPSQPPALVSHAHMTPQTCSHMDMPFTHILTPDMHVPCIHKKRSCLRTHMPLAHAYAHTYVCNPLHMTLSHTPLPTHMWITTPCTHPLHTRTPHSQTLPHPLPTQTSSPSATLHSSSPALCLLSDPVSYPQKVPASPTAVPFLTASLVLLAAPLAPATPHCPA